MTIMTDNASIWLYLARMSLMFDGQSLAVQYIPHALRLLRLGDKWTRTESPASPQL